MTPDAHANQVDLEPDALRASHTRGTWLPKDMLLTVVHAGEEDERLSRELFAPARNNEKPGEETEPESSATLLRIQCDPGCIDPEKEDAATSAATLTRALESLIQAPLPDAAGATGSIGPRVLVAIGPSASMTVLAALDCDIDALILLSPVAAELAQRKSDDERHEGFARCFTDAAPLDSLGRLKCRVLLAWPAGGSERILRCARAWRLAFEKAEVPCESAVVAFSGDRLEADVGTLGAVRTEIDHFLHSVARNGSNA